MKADDKKKLWVIGGIILIIAYTQGWLPGQQAVWDQGTLCEIPSGGGSCEATFTIPEGKRLSDAYVELGFESIESDMMPVSGLQQESKVIHNPGDTCLGQIPCPYADGDHRGETIFWHYSFSNTDFQSISYEVQGHLTASFRLDSSTVISDEWCRNQLYLYMGNQRLTSHFLRGDLAPADGDDDNWGCRYSYFEENVSVAVYDYEGGAYVPGCKETVNIDVDVPLTSSTGNMTLRLVYNADDFCNANIIAEPQFTVTSFSHTFEESINTFALNIGESTIETEMSDVSIGNITESIQFPNAANIYCERTTSNDACDLVLTISSATGGNVYLLEHFIIVNNDLYDPPDNTTNTSGVDANGCYPSAGEQWCELEQKCYRSWEDTCEASPLCPAVCTPLWNLNNDTCVYDSCGSGCGANGDTTFNTRTACETAISDGPPIFGITDPSKYTMWGIVAAVAVAMIFVIRKRKKKRR